MIFSEFIDLRYWDMDDQLKKNRPIYLEIRLVGWGDRQFFHFVGKIHVPSRRFFPILLAHVGGKGFIGDHGSIFCDGHQSFSGR